MTTVHTGHEMAAPTQTGAPGAAARPDGPERPGKPAPGTRTGRRGGSGMGLTTRIAVWSATRPWRAIGLWLLVVVAAVSLGSITAPRQATQLDLGVGQSGRGDSMAAAAGFVDKASENVLVTSATGAPLDTTAAAEVAGQVAARLSALPLVESVTPPLPSANGDAVLVQARLGATAQDAAEQLAPVRDVVASAQAANPQLRVEQVGAASISQDFSEWLDKDLATATSLSLPVTLLILLVSFGALVMAGIPVVLGLAAVASSLGLWALVSQVVPDPGMVLHLILLVGMAVGVDYSLFYMRRYREERHRGVGNVDSVRIAAQTAGHSVIVSGTAVILAMAGLFVAQDAVFSAMAAGAILVVVVALVSSVTVLPALLVKLGRWVDRPRVPVLWRLSSGDRSPRVVSGVVGFVVRRPAAALLLALAILGALAAPLLTMNLKSTQIADYPRELSSMVSYDRLLAAFPDNTNTDVVVVTVPPERAAALDGALARLQAQVGEHPDLFGEVGDTWRSADGRTARVSIAVPHPVDSAPARSSVTLLRDTITPSVFGPVEGAQYAVSGDIAADLDYTHNVSQKLPVVIAAVLLMTFAVMLFSYRSVTVGLITVLLNVLSIGAAFGVLALVFQHTWAQDLLGFTSTGHIVSWVPTLLVVVLAGLSLDYHVFVVSRIRENTKAGMPMGPAVRDGLARTAGVVTSAAAVMVGVFSVFGALTFLELKQIGVGLAVGILVDATVIRVLALPAMLMVCRRWVWPAGYPRTQVRSPSAAGQPR